MKFNDETAWKIIKTKKCERTEIEKIYLYQWKYKWVYMPFRIIMFPINLVIKLYKWTYDN